MFRARTMLVASKDSTSLPSPRMLRPRMDIPRLPCPRASTPLFRPTPNRRAARHLQCRRHEALFQNLERSEAIPTCDPSITNSRRSGERTPKEGSSVYVMPISKQIELSSPDR